MTTPAAGRPVPGFWWRTLAPIGVVPIALFVALIVLVVLAPTPLGDRSRGVIAGAAASALILVLALALRATLPSHLEYWSTALKHTWGGAVGLGVTVGAGLLVATVSIVALASAIDPSAERHLDDLRDDV